MEKIRFVNGQWYWVECETKQVENQNQKYYYGYLIDDSEIVDYMNAYADDYITSE